MTRKVAIIGGGLSLSKIDINQYLQRDKFIIALNDGWRGFKDPDLVFSIDTVKLTERFGDCPYKIVVAVPKYFGTSRAAINIDRLPAPSNVGTIQRLPGVGFSTKEDEVYGGYSSGYGALNYALTELRPKFVFLFGFDYRDMGDHWHEHKDPREPQPSRQAEMIQSFNYIPHDKGVNIFNCSLDSALDNFPKLSPREGITLWNSIKSF